ncbi:EF-hand and coiled-coil domain-containing protein 1 isoform X2 [Pithys albifrons albifrons]|uniref:EF-hand and coiled-coil domain-containing protein 1 isoform X2 n=1 Tax=Pithys albifrons albifrons TaxID=3385563 RepID=UPI003A5CE718
MEPAEGRDPYGRPARRTQWLVSALAYHYGLDRGVENEIVVLATGLDQYLQEIFHHLDCAGAGRIPGEDFRTLCRVLGLEEAADPEECAGLWDGLSAGLTFRQFHARLCGFFSTQAGGAEPRLPLGRDSEHIETQIRLRSPRRRRRADPRAPDSEHRIAQLEEENGSLRELVEDMRAALQSSDARCLALQVGLRKSHAKHKEEGPCFLGSKRPLTQNHSQTKCLQSVLKEMELIWSSRDGQIEEAIRFNQELERELRSSQEALLTLEDCNRNLKREQAEMRRKVEEARHAVLSSLGKVKELELKANAVPHLQIHIQQLESELQHYRSGMERSQVRLECGAERPEQPEQLEQLEHPEHLEQLEQLEHPEHLEQLEQLEGLEQSEQLEQPEQSQDLEQLEQLEKPEQLEPLEQLEQLEHLEHPELSEQPEQLEQLEHPEELEQPERAELGMGQQGPRCSPGTTEHGTKPSLIEGPLFRSVEGQAASDEEEEQWTDDQAPPMGHIKKMLAKLPCCGSGCDEKTWKKLMSYLGTSSTDGCGTAPVDLPERVPPLELPGHGGRKLETNMEEVKGPLLGELQQKVEETELLKMELQMLETERVRLSLVEEKLMDVLQLLQQLRDLNISKRALGKILLSTLESCRDPQPGKAHLFEVLDTLHQELMGCELLHKEPVEQGQSPQALANALVISC